MKEETQEKPTFINAKIMGEEKGISKETSIIDTDVGATNDENHDVTPVIKGREMEKKEINDDILQTTDNTIIDVIKMEEEEGIDTIEPDERFKKPKLERKWKEEEKKETSSKAMNPDFKKSIRKEERRKRYYVFRDRAKNFFRIENPFESVFRLADFTLNVFVLSVMGICIIKAVDFINQGDWVMSLVTGSFVLLLSWINRQII